MKMLFQIAVTNSSLDFIIQGDGTGCPEDRGQFGHCLAMLRGCSKKTKHIVLQSKAETAESTLNIH